MRKHKFLAFVLLTMGRRLHYHNKLILAPMVRVCTLPMRLLALEFGADIVYSEELVDFKLMKCERRVNNILNTVDFVQPSDGEITFRTCSLERQHVVVQLGTADADRALAVGKLIQNDVAGLDINMGCPKEFSVKGGMGAALLENTRLAKDILQTLCDNLSIPVTCKIRILPQVESTIELVKELASTGIAAIAIHARTRDERPQQQPHLDFINKIAKCVNIPVIANGGSREIHNYADLFEFRKACDADSVMIARAAQLNASIFRKEGLLSTDEVIYRYLQLSVDFENAPHNTKYCIQNMLKHLQETSKGKQFLQCQTLQQMCDIWDLGDYCQKKQNELRKYGLFDQRAVVPAVLPQDNGDINFSFVQKRKKLDLSLLSTDVVELSVLFLRSNYADTQLPKSVLYAFACRNGKANPKYVTQYADRLFRAICIFDNKKYTSTFWEKNKKQAEQVSALVCLYNIGLIGKEELLENGSLLA